jgi:hypothetical protein
MNAACTELTDLDGLSVADLKVLLQEKHAQLVIKDAQILSHTLEIEALKLQFLRLRQMQFGKRSEKREREIAQLELWVEELETDAAQRSCEPDQQTATKRAPRVRKPRREFPAHLPRETQTIAPQQSCCPDCGGELKRLGEDVSDMLELEPVRVKVIRQVRPKLACASCDTSCRRRRRRARSNAAWPVPDSWRTWSSASTPIICRSIGRRRSSRARVSNSTARCSHNGSGT